jgi:hypothetical protein
MSMRGLSTFTPFCVSWRDTAETARYGQGWQGYDTSCDTRSLNDASGNAQCPRYDFPLFRAAIIPSEPLEQLFQLRVKSLCQCVQGVNSGGDGSILDLAKVRSPNSSHVGKLGLRQAVLFP